MPTIFLGYVVGGVGVSGFFGAWRGLTWGIAGYLVGWDAAIFLFRP
jgi:hypothetical protein